MPSHNDGELTMKTDTHLTIEIDTYLGDCVVTNHGKGTVYFFNGVKSIRLRPENSCVMRLDNSWSGENFNEQPKNR